MRVWGGGNCISHVKWKALVLAAASTALVSYISHKLNKLEHTLDVYLHILTYIDIFKTLTTVTETPQILLNPTLCIILQISIRFHYQ